MKPILNSIRFFADRDNNSEAAIIEPGDVPRLDQHVEKLFAEPPAGFFNDGEYDVGQLLRHFGRTVGLAVNSRAADLGGPTKQNLQTIFTQLRGELLAATPAARTNTTAPSPTPRPASSASSARDGLLTETRRQMTKAGGLTGLARVQRAFERQART